MLSLPLCINPRLLDIARAPYVHLDMPTVSCDTPLLLVHFLGFDAWLGRWGVSLCLWQGKRQ